MISEDEALKCVNDLTLPAVKDRDILQYAGYKFSYKNNEWSKLVKDIKDNLLKLDNDIQLDARDNVVENNQ